MDEEKKKKIRVQLINFINQELLLNKKHKKSNFLINSMTLEQLEKKNMQCKIFFIEEKNQTYQNINNGWTIGLNIYINNISNSNPFVYSLTNIIKDNLMIKDITNINSINMNRFNNSNKETIIQKRSNKLLYIEKEGNFGSPVDTSLLIKKELGERILKCTNKEFNSNKLTINYSERFFTEDTIENEKDKINKIEKETKFFYDKNINENEENLIFPKQLSNETLGTEISRIINICHEDRYTQSFDHYPSDSQISEQSKKIKIAKMYAKKLKLYCHTLKRKFPLNNKIIKINENNLNLNRNKNEDIKNNINYSDKNYINNINKKLKKISSFGLLNAIKNNEEESKNENNQFAKYKQIIPNKRIRSGINIKLKIKKYGEDNENEKNNDVTISSNNNGQFKTLNDKIIKKRISALNINKKKKRKTVKEEIKSKTKLKFKKDLIKSPIKLKIRNKRLTHINKAINGKFLLTDSPLININKIKEKKEKESIKEIVKNKNITDTNKDTNLNKIIRSRKNLEDFNKNEKSSNFIFKRNEHKKCSVEKKINLSGLENLNFWKMKHKTTCEPLLFNKKRTKKKVIMNDISISNKRDSSPSISLDKKYIKKRNKIKNNTNRFNNANNRGEKKKTLGFFNTKKSTAVIEILKKMKKRKSTNYNNDKIVKFKRRLSPINNDNTKVSSTNFEFNKKNQDSFKEQSFIFNDFNYEKGNKETDIFNIMDELLYKKKHERSRKCNIINFD